MRIVALIFCLAVLIFLTFSNAYCSDNKEEKFQTKESEACGAVIDAADVKFETNPLNKLGRGLVNFLTSPCEIPASWARVTEEKGDLTSFTVGTIEGVFTTFLRALTGLYDTVTFVIPPYNKPLMEPEYAIDSLDQATR